jgi:hypothetical protein
MGQRLLVESWSVGTGSLELLEIEVLLRRPKIKAYLQRKIDLTRGLIANQEMLYRTFGTV